jgi:hypothetical protein
MFRPKPSRFFSGRRRLAMALLGTASVGLASLAALPTPDLADPRQAVVYIMVELGGVEFVEPPAPGETPRAFGSGVIIDDERILTCAHVVDYAARIEVRREGTSSWADARIEFWDETSDLALLKVDEPGFFDAVQPVPLGSLPALGEPLQLLGYPKGSHTLLVRDGVLSGVGLEAYSMFRHELLMARIDVTMISGISGGPAVHRGKLVGLGVQMPHVDEEVRDGQLIALPVIEHFLEDVEDGRVDGCFGLRTPFQPLTDITARRDLGIPDGLSGVQILGPRSDYLFNTFFPGDFLFELDGHPIPDDGQVAVGPHQVDFEYLVQRLQGDQLVEAKVIRDGEPQTVRLKTVSNWVAPRWR